MEKAANSLARGTSLLAAAPAGSRGGPLPRLAVPMADCLVRRMLRLMPGVADALIDPSECMDGRCVRSARRSFFELSPFPKAAFAVTNRAVIEATEDEKVRAFVSSLNSLVALNSSKTVRLNIIAKKHNHIIRYTV